MKPLLSIVVFFAVAMPLLAQPLPAGDADRLPDGAVARVGSARFRTNSSFADFTFSPDGKLIAGSSFGRRFAVWEVATGRELMAARVGYGLVRFTADGKLVIVAHRGEHGLELRCYEPQTGRPGFKVGDSDFRIDIGSAWPIVIHQWKIGPNNTLWVQGSPGPGVRELRGFELPGGKEIARIRVPDGATVIDWTPDGSQLMLKNGERLALHEVKTSRATWELDLNEKENSTFGMTPDGKRIVSRQDRRLRVHDIATGRDVRLGDAAWGPTAQLLLPHARFATSRSQSSSGAFDFGVLDLDRSEVRLSLPAIAIQASTFSPDGRYFAASVGAGTSVWDLTRSSTDPIVRLPGSASARFAPDGRILALDGFGCLSLYEVGSWRPLPQSASPVSCVWSPRFTPDGRGLVGLTSEGWREWSDWSNPESKLIFGHSEGNRSLASLLSEDMQTAAATVGIGSLGPKTPAADEIRVTDRRTARTRTYPVAGWRDRHVELSGDGRRLFTWAQVQKGGGWVRAWNTATGESIATWVVADRFRFEVSLSASHDGRWLATIPAPEGGGLGGIRIWDVERKREAGQLEGIAGTGNRGHQEACFSRDGRRLAAVVFDRSEPTGSGVRVWHWRTGKQLFSTSVGDFLTVVSLSADGRSCAVGEFEGRLRVFEVATGRERIGFQHDGQITSVAFHPDGTKLAAGSPEAPVYIWNLLGDRGRWDPANADEIWTALSSTDAKAAFAATRQLRAHPTDAIAFFRDRPPLPPAPTAEQLADLLKRLDAPAFADRERAQKELTEVVEWIRPKLEAARKKSSGEVAQRIDRLLAPSERPTASQLRQVRACEVLEGVASDEAIKTLRAWATGPDGARLTIEARESLERLRP